MKLLAQTFLDLWETPACLDWMENMVSVVVLVLQAPPVQAQPRETEVILGSQASLAPLAGKETQQALEVRDSLAAQVLREREVRPVSVEVLDSRVSLVTLVTMETKDLRAYKAFLVVRVSPASLSHLRESVYSMETLGHRERMEPLEHLESLVNLECLDVQALKDAPVVWVNWAGPVLLVHLDLSETLDLQVSLDPLENKVSLVHRDVPAHPAASDAAPVSATLW